MRFILRCLATAVAVSVVIWIIPGFNVIGGNQAWGAIILFSVILALINSSIKPILQVLSLPISIVTLGIFFLVVNTFMLYLATWITNGLFGVGFEITSFGWAFLASIIISIVSGVINSITGANERNGKA